MDCWPLVERFLEEVNGLRGKLAVLLLQLPPKLEFDRKTTAKFLEALAAATPARVVCEPRNVTWFESEADHILCQLRVGRVGADPAITSVGGEPGGWRELSYLRLHGSPKVYYSSYDDPRLENYAAIIRSELAEGRRVWCVFDNTASSAAARNALTLATLLEMPKAMAREGK